MNDFKYDYYRLRGTYKIKPIELLKSQYLRFIFMYRYASNTKNKLTKKIVNHYFSKLGRKSGLEIPITAEIGKGLLLIHPYAITINSKAKIGKNCTMLKGSTIGNQKRGKKSGAPTLGDYVYVGLNSSIVGNVTIGDNVLIAPNTYVNFDVPSNSIVIGSPGIIHSNKNATECYHNNKI